MRGGAGRPGGVVFGDHNERGSRGVLNSGLEGWLGGVQLGIASQADLKTSPAASAR